MWKTSVELQNEFAIVCGNNQNRFIELRTIHHKDMINTYIVLKVNIYMSTLEGGADN